MLKWGTDLEEKKWKGAKPKYTVSLFQRQVSNDPSVFPQNGSSEGNCKQWKILHAQLMLRTSVTLSSLQKKMFLEPKVLSY